MATVDQLLVKIDASTEALRREMTRAQGAVQTSTAAMQRNVTGLDARFVALSATMRTQLASSAAGLTGSLGPLGSALTALGPKGLAAGVAIGGLVLALRGLGGAVGQAVQDVGDLADAAEAIGVSTDTLQSLQFAGVQAGLGVDEVGAALQKLSQNLGEAGQGNEAAIKKFYDLGVAIYDVNGNLRTVGDVLPEVAQGISELGGPSAQLASTIDLFGRSAGKLAPALAGGASGLADLVREATEAGAVIDSALVRSAGEASDRMDALALATDQQMNAALVRLAPELENINGLWQTMRGAMAAALAILAEFAERAPDLAKAIENSIGQTLAAMIPGLNVVAAGVGAAALTGALGPGTDAPPTTGGGGGGGGSGFQTPTTAPPTVPTAPPTAPRSRGGGGRSEADQFAEQSSEIQARVAAIRSLTEAYGQSAEAVRAAEASQRILGQTQALSAKLTADQRAQMEGFITALDAANQKAEQAKSLFNVDQTLGEQLATAQAEYDLMGASEQTRARELALLELRNQLLREGVTNVDEELQKRSATIDATIRLQSETERVKQLSQDIGGVLSEGFKAAITGAESLNDILAGVLNKLADILLNDAFSALQEQSGGFLSGILSALGLGGGGKQIGKFGAPSASYRAGGGPVTAGMPYIVGEEGRELFVPRMAGNIVSNDNLGSMGGGGLTITNVITINAPNAQPGVSEELRRATPAIIEQATNRMLQRMRTERTFSKLVRG